MKSITKTRVMTRGIIVDIIANIKNMIGMRINQYEDLITKAQEELWAEIESEGHRLKWYRYEITQFTNGAIMVVLYGEAR